MAYRTIEGLAERPTEPGSMADGSSLTDTFTVDGGTASGPFQPAPLPLRFDIARSTGGNVGAVEIRGFGLLRDGTP